MFGSASGSFCQTPRPSYILEVTRQSTTPIAAINKKLQDSCNNPSSMGRMPEFRKINA